MFYKKFQKVSAVKPNILSKSLAAGKQFFGGAAKGVQQAGKSTISDTLKLKGLGSVGQAAKSSGGWSKAVSTPTGRRALGEGVGKALPSIGMGGAYLYGGKKLYDKLSDKPASQEYYYA